MTNRCHPVMSRDRPVGDAVAKVPPTGEWAHQDSNLEPRDYAYHFGFRRQGAPVRGLDCAFTVDESVGASVSSLYTFPSPGLARRWHGRPIRPKRSPTLRRY